MVAAPESLVAQAHADAQNNTAANKVAKPVVNGEQQHTETEQQQQQATTEGEGSSGVYAEENGVNGFTVADASTSTSTHQERTAAQLSSQRSHLSNFDPTPTATANLPPPDIARHIPCRFFPLGTCKYGDTCAFSHGVAGVAGSPGVPPSPSVAAAVVPEQQQQQHVQQQHVQQQHQQHYMPQPEEYSGMPMYYPPMEEYYGQAPFSPQQAYYPFPPPFQHYPQHYQQVPPPQAYYPAPPQPQLIPNGAAAPESTSSPVDAPSSSSANGAPTSPEVQRALSPSTQAFPSPSAPQQVPLGAAQPFVPYPQQQFVPGQGPEQYGYQQVPTSPPTVFGPDGLPLPVVGRQERTPSLHTFFQTGAAPTPSSQQPVATSSAPNGFPKGAPRGPAAASSSPSALNARRSLPPMNGGGPNGFNNNNKPRPRFPPGTPRPPCSFFEANRCKNRDTCPFAHPLPDGTDARTLGQGWMGADGRTENPEMSGGLPAVWLANPRFGNGHGHHRGANGAGQGGQGGAFVKGPNNFNGGYSVREPRPRNRFEEERDRAVRVEQQQNAAQAAAQATTTPATNGDAETTTEATSSTTTPASTESKPVTPQQPLTHPLPPAPHHHHQHHQHHNGPRVHHNGPFVNGAAAGGRVPGASAPQLVAAINGITRGTRSSAPSSQHHQSNSHANNNNNNNASTPSTSTAAATPAVIAQPQRVPSGADFPALSPALEGPTSAPLANVEVNPAAPSLASVVEASTPAAAPAPVKKEVPVVEQQQQEPEHDFVMVSHADATPPTPAAADAAPAPTAVVDETPAPAPAPVAAAPKPILSFASAAARGAAVVLPEKPKRVSVMPTPAAAKAEKVEEKKVAGDEKKEGQGQKKGGKGKGGKKVGGQGQGAQGGVKA